MRKLFAVAVVKRYVIRRFFQCFFIQHFLFNVFFKAAVSNLWFQICGFKFAVSNLRFQIFYLLLYLNTSASISVVGIEARSITAVLCVVLNYHVIFYIDMS